MRLKKLFQELKRLKYMRSQYEIKPYIKFHVDDRYYAFSVFPTIVFEPWIYRNNYTPIIDIHWLNIHILIGKFTVKE